MLFNPQESIDFQGNTGPFIQYTYARIRSILRNAEGEDFIFNPDTIELSKVEKDLLLKLSLYPKAVKEAGLALSPGIICNYIYELSKNFSQFYHDHTILKDPDFNQKHFRLNVCALSARVIQSGFAMLGIRVAERM